MSVVDGFAYLAQKETNESRTFGSGEEARLTLDVAMFVTGPIACALITGIAMREQR